MQHAVYSVPLLYDTATVHGETINRVFHDPYAAAPHWGGMGVGHATTAGQVNINYLICTNNPKLIPHNAEVVIIVVARKILTRVVNDVLTSRPGMKIIIYFTHITAPEQSTHGSVIHCGTDDVVLTVLRQITHNANLEYSAPPKAPYGSLRPPREVWRVIN